MQKLFFLLIIFSGPHLSNAQANTRDTLKYLQQLLQKEKNDTSRVLILSQLSYAYAVSKPDSAMLLGQKGLELSRRISFPKGEAGCLDQIGNVYNTLGNYPKAMEVYLEALKIREKINNVEGIASSLRHIGGIYYGQGEYRKAFEYWSKSKKLFEQTSNKFDLANILLTLGIYYLRLKQYDSATAYTRQAYEITRKVAPNRSGGVLSIIATIYSETGQRKLALEYFHRSFYYFKLNDNDISLSNGFLGIAKFFETERQGDSALFYANKALKIVEGKKITKLVLDVSSFLSSFYKKRGNSDSALFYLEVAKAANDSLFSQQKIKQFQSLAFDEQIRQRDVEAERSRYQNQIRLYILLSAVIVFLLIATFLFRNNKQKQKVNAVLKQQNEKTEKAYEQLKATQAQLIQSEKMASLGELTAGIAHEIQNPLNFMNNFSEVNAELIDEMQQELNSGSKEEAISISNEIKENEHKISHHGKRADAIVKGMLQHSRASSGQKEPTDINALADEYLRLAYQGQRAKDKSFNVKLITDFDPSIGKINIIPQDIGRVLLNLYNNAFYALAEKNASASLAGQSYEPTISVSTKRINDNVEISVKDNGDGIPQKVVDKIFQPFFTTKPTGQGTGLGLSLAYDIVTKGHGGTLEVESKEGEGSEFKIKLLIQNI